MALLRVTVKKNTLSHNGIQRLWFKKVISIDERLALQLSKCLEETSISEWMIKGKYSDTERPQKSNHPLKLKTANMSYYDAENPDSTLKRGFITRLYTMDCFRKNIKDSTSEQDKWFTVH